jgi:AraC-like DNA-binding protein
MQLNNRKNKYQHKMQQVASWIESHLQENLGLDQAAAEFGLSRSLFSREFHRHTGMSFVEHCNIRRIEKAALVLSSTDLNITEVAFGSGFSNLSHFHRQFKANYGLTPGAFRRKMIEEGGR